MTVHDTTIVYAEVPATEISDEPQTNRTESTAAVQIAATGVRYFGLTFDSAPEAGRPPSREKAKIMREAEVTVARPQSSCATKTTM